MPDHTKWMVPSRPLRDREVGAEMIGTSGTGIESNTYETHQKLD